MMRESAAARDLTKSKLAEHGITVINNARIKEISDKGVFLNDDRFIDCNVPVWATGAEAHQVTMRSTNIDILDGYFRVNDYL